MSRYERQIRLAEIGEGGQEKLLAATVALGAEGFARDVERAYVRLAGPIPVEGGAPRAVDVAALGLRHQAPREIAEGALRALVALRALLGMP